MRLKFKRGTPAEPTCGTRWCVLAGVRPVLEERPTKDDVWTQRKTYRAIYARLRCPRCRKRWGGLIDMVDRVAEQR